MGNIYDGVFRTILNDCRKLIIPVINEIFEEQYNGNEEVQFFPNEHFIDQQGTANQERITDTNFTILGDTQKKYHIECESSLPDGKIMVRLFEYDAQIALDERELTEETLTVTFPHTAVLYLRTYKKTPDKMKYVIMTPGGIVQYNVPIMKVQAYSLNDIFEKQLLLLIPFYIFSYEKYFQNYNTNEQQLEELKTEYQNILRRLDKLEYQGVIGSFDKRTIIELSNDVIQELSQKYTNIQKGIGDIMGGALIETEARTILNQGIQKGIQKGIKQGIKQGIEQGKNQGIHETKKENALKMLKRGKLTIEEISEDSGLTIEEVKQLAGL